MKKIYIYIFFIISVQKAFTQVVPDFQIPDTVCVNEPISIVNNTTGATTYHWNFCLSSFDTNLKGINLGNPFSSLDYPNDIFTVVDSVSNNHYAFVCTHGTPADVVRINFGNNFLNNPVSIYSLGNFGGLIVKGEGIQIHKENSNWIGYIVNSEGNSNDRIIKLNFGASITNTPSVTNLGNIGNMNRPHGFLMLKEGSTWYGFIANIYNNTLTKLVWSSSLINSPVATNIGNIGNLNGPVELCGISENNISYLFVTNNLNSTITRLNFGNSYSNTPTGTNLGNPSGILNYPVGIEILKDCQNTFGYIANYSNDNVIKLVFNGGIGGTINVSIAGISGLFRPHGLSMFFRQGDSLYSFLTNYYGNNVLRVYLADQSCNNSSIPSSYLQNPLPFSYNRTGIYTISLSVDEGMPTQGNLCKDVVVVHANIYANNATICNGQVATLTASGGSIYNWSSGQNGNPITVSPSINTTYTVTGTNSNGCTNVASCMVTVGTSISLTATGDTICNGSTASITAVGAITYTWNTGQQGNSVIVTPVVTTTYIVTGTDINGCIGTTSCSVIVGNLTLSTSQTPTNCFPNGTAIVNVLSGTSPYMYTWSSVPQQNTQTAININSGLYTVTVVDSKGCSNVGSIVVNESNPLSISISSTPKNCGQMGGSATLNASGGDSTLYTYIWSDGETTQTITNLVQGSYTGTVYYGTCEVSATATILQTAGPRADFTYIPQELDIFENTTAFFNDLSIPGGQPIVRWYWDFGGCPITSIAEVQNPTHTFNYVGTMTVCLTVTDLENCVDSICKPIVIKDIFTVYIPNAFSPNSDMLNEGFIPQGYRIDPTGFTMIIFNRWGEEIYKTNDLNSPWNGRYFNTGDIVQTDVYVYRIIAKEMDNGPEYVFIGRVSVIK